jgi:hypothetical protein
MGGRSWYNLPSTDQMLKECKPSLLSCISEISSDNLAELCHLFAICTFLDWLMVKLGNSGRLKPLPCTILEFCRKASGQHC